MSFTKFRELPGELQIRIFEYAIPDPRSIKGAILVIIGRNLSKPRAILPNLREFEKIHSMETPMIHSAGDELLGDVWHPANQRMLESRSFVFHILHACKIARTVALGIYRLDMHSIIAEENIPWWNPELDNLYFQQQPKQGSYIDYSTFLATRYWLLGDNNRCPITRSHFKYIQHVTLCLDHNLAPSLGLTPETDRGKNLGGLLTLPTLETLNLLLDPGRIGESDHGDILYYEPEDVPIELCCRKKPADVERHIKKFLKEIGPKDRETPDVNLFVMGVRGARAKDSSKRLVPLTEKRLLSTGGGLTLEDTSRPVSSLHICL